MVLDFLKEHVSHSTTATIGSSFTTVTHTPVTRIEEKIITAVFFDMRNFTQISEYLSPLQVVQIINTYLSIITDALHVKGGTLTSYTGDQVMAIFNAPIPMINHAEKAIHAAQYAMDRLEAFNQSRRSDILPLKASFGAGVESGNVIVGVIGTQLYQSYTAIGDAVNVAARLCDLAPASHVYVGERAVGLAAESCGRRLTELGDQHLRGRKGPVQAYCSSHDMARGATAEPLPSRTEGETRLPEVLPPALDQVAVMPAIGG